MQKDFTTHSNGNREESLISRCCRFISWQKKSILKSAQANIAKWKHFSQKAEGQNLPPIFALLIDLYNGVDVFGILEECRINPDYNSKYSLRNDLEFYVPQLTNFMIFHEDLSGYKLNAFLQNLSKADPYFAHLYYWYTNSLMLATDDTKTRDIITDILKICSHEAETQLFFKDYQKFYLALQKKFPQGEYDKEMKEIQSKQAALYKFIQQYRDDKFKISDLDFESRASYIELRPYISPILQGDQAYSSNPFTSTLLLFEDLYTTAQEMNNMPDKLKFLKGQLRKINKALPSSVYIPFVGESVRSCAILGMVVSETKIFSTKERAPFYICLELFRPQEELAHEYTDLFHPEFKKHKSKALLDWAKKKLGRNKSSTYNKIPDNPTEEISDEEFNVEKMNKLMSSPLKLKQFPSLTRLSPIKEHNEGSPDSKDSTSNPAETHSQELSHRKSSGSSEHIKNFPNNTELKLRHSVSSEDSIEKSEYDVVGTPICKGGRFPRLGTPVSSQASPGKTTGSFTGFFESASKGLNESPEEKKGEDLKTDRERCLTEPLVQIPVRFENDPFFGEDSKAQTQRIRDQSPFRDLKTWRLLHLIVKAGADMKEEQFALQLISQFQQIFKAEKLKLILTPFEIISLGPDIGLVEFVKDSITLSSLKEKMYKQNIPSLKAFFECYYGKDVEKARKRFCRSLAAYSVICYFLQIKDRHNGNIMLHKKGHIFHLDFGFFLSNAPGKGLEFERTVPFKLLNEYVEVLGGPRSRMFQEFRKLFYKGFMAAHKHREQILILVKMMYSSQGNNLPCFKGGLKSITELEQRFCPIGINEKDMTSYCYTLINQSLDNWRARCYDKYQYYMQGIFY